MPPLRINRYWPCVAALLVIQAGPMTAADVSVKAIEMTSGTELQDSSILSIDPYGNAPSWGIQATVPCQSCVTSATAVVQASPGHGHTYWTQNGGSVSGNGVLGFQASAEGGRVTISWNTSNNGTTIASGTLRFSILGQNPAFSSVDGQIAGQAWFFPNILNLESNYRQYKIASNDLNNVPVGSPLISSDTYGVGIGQYDPRAHQLSDADYWDWSTNLSDVNTVLNAAQQPAYNFWSSQVTQMQNQNPGTYPHQVSFPYCSFAYPGQGSGASFGDADWMTGYNGTGGTSRYPRGYFIYWRVAANNNPGSWVIQSDSGNSYVGDVCSTPAL